MRNSFKSDDVNLQEIVSIALTAWGAIYFISGIARINIKSTIKTIIGGYLLYRGISDYREANEPSYSAFDQNDLISVTETEVLSTSQDPTIE